MKTITEELMESLGGVRRAIERDKPEVKFTKSNLGLCGSPCKSCAGTCEASCAGACKGACSNVCSEVCIIRQLCR